MLSHCLIILAPGWPPPKSLKSRPSCEIKGHITKGQFGSVFNHIYCSCISGSLFSCLLVAERIMRVPTEKTAKTSSTCGSSKQTDTSTCRSPPAVLILRDGFNLCLVCHSPYYILYGVSVLHTLQSNSWKDTENKKE